MIRILHIAAKTADERVWSPLFREHLGRVGEFSLVENGAALPEEDLAERIRASDVLMTCWGSVRCPDGIVGNPGRLRYVCNVTGEASPYVPEDLLASGILVSNWGDDPAQRVAEGAMTLLLAVLKDLQFQSLEVRGGGWRMDMDSHGGTIENSAVGIYGFGAVGRRFAELIRPFRPALRVYDPYIDRLPDGIVRCDSLDELFEGARIVSVHAALTSDTRRSVTARHFAMLPDGGVVINTARGAILDQDALFAELASGRLRAGLDVLDPDSLPDGHPARLWPNLLLTAHRVEYGWPPFWKDTTTLSSMQKTALDNVRAFAEGGEMRFLFDSQRFARST